ncbi:MAG: response regulator transcription factor [Bacteroidota bacterium]
MIRLAIVDDHLILQKGLALILESFVDCELIFTALNGQELIDQLPKQSVDVILMDLEMPVMDGIEATRYVREHYPEIKIILLTMHDNEQYISHLVELGANAYLLKNEEDQELHRAIRAVHQHDFYFNDYVQQALLKRVRKQSRPSFQQNIVNLLTAREKEVIGLICQELSSKEIADQLFISNKTVETHRKNIREKIGVKNTAGLVIFAMQNGLVPGLNGSG